MVLVARQHDRRAALRRARVVSDVGALRGVLGQRRGLAAPLARPYYEAWCLDDAEEIAAHIRLQVREWNEEAEFHALGNPNTTGTESRWSSGPIDIDDLNDWATQTPGREKYPSLLIAR